MNRLLSCKWVLFGIRVIVGAVFVYAGAVKFANPAQFADSIASFQLLPDTLISILALGLPPVEIIAGLMMILGWHHRSANLAILILTGVFALALIQGLARGLQIDCGCFGNGKPTALKTWISLGRDILLFLAAFLTYRANFKASTAISHTAES